MVFRLIDPERLSATEDVDADRVDELERKILRERTWTRPIAVHEAGLFVMDGHHRLAVAARLDLGSVPVILLDYGSVRVEAWREGETVRPSDIVDMARRGRRFPVKTTRHIFDPSLPGCDVPLSDLLGTRARGDASLPASSLPSS